MASSGTVIGNSLNVQGGHVARVRVEWQVASQNIGGNYSTINWQGYVDFFGCDAQLDNGHVNWSGVTALYNNGGRVYNYAGNFSNHTVPMGSSSFNISHDGAGNAGLNLDGSVAVFSTGTSSGSGSWILPTIPRYAACTAVGVSNLNDQGLTAYASADNYCSAIEFSVDGGANWINMGAGSNAQYAYNNLASNTTFNVYSRLTRADSGLQTTSGATTVTTLPQSNILAFL